MWIAFRGSIPKEAAFPEANEDMVTVCEDAERIALSDGASESFDAQRWARLLTERFVIDPGVDGQWVQERLAVYRSAFVFNALSWAQQMAFERGSFATLLGIQIQRQLGRIDILAIGDSLALLVDGNMLVASWPYADPEQFNTRPTLLSTKETLNAFMGDPNFDTTHRTRFDLTALADPVLLCTTDALGQWVLREGNEALTRLQAIRSEDALRDLVLAERAGKRMRTDDSTLLVVHLRQPEEAHGGLPLA